jgi:hypothetical protein
VSKKKGGLMGTNSLIMANKAIVKILIIGIALAILTGCGIGHGPYRHGYDGYHVIGSDYDYRNNTSNGAMYYPDGRGYHRRAPGYGDGRGRYCGW